MHVKAVWTCLVLQTFSVGVGRVFADPGGDAPAETPQTNPAKPADYGAAFELLINLGLPDAKGATYVTLTLQDAPPGGNQAYRNFGYSGRDPNADLKGNAWLLPGAADGKSTLIYQIYETINVVKTAKRGKLLRILTGPGKKAGTDERQGDWEEQDVASDANSLLKLLDTPSLTAMMLNSERWSYDDSGPRWCGKLLVMACHFYRAGHTNEANQITQRLFDLAPEPILIIDRVIDDLAEQQYGDLTQSFFTAKDWKAYHDGIQQLVSRFSRGWKNREGAEVLLTHLQARVEGAQPSLTPLRNVTLDPKAVTILEGWLSQDGPIQLNVPSCWLLGTDLSPEDEEEEYDDEEEQGANEQPWIAELVGLGMDGFIAMTAAATDETLIPTSMDGRSREDSYEFGMSRVFHSGFDADTYPGQLQYTAMTRPCSRGEIARAIILQTLPDPDGNLQGLPPADLQAAALAWWLEHRSDSNSQLARLFLQTGAPGQQSMGMLALINSGEEADAQVVESHILNAEDLPRMIDMVETYVQARRGAAAPFFEKYSKAVLDQSGTGEEDRFQNSSWQVREAGGMEKYLKKLSVYVRDVSAKQILEDLRKGELAPAEGLPMLEIANGAGTLRTHLPELVSLARLQEDPDGQLQFLRALYRASYQDMEHHYGADKFDDYIASLPALLASSKDEWTYFLQQTEPLANPDLEMGGTTLARTAASIMDSIYFPRHQGTQRALSQVLGTEGFWDFMLAQGLRTLAEGSDAGFPDAARVDEEKRKAIQTKLAGLSAIEIISYYEGLGLDEKLAWSEILQGIDASTTTGMVDLKSRIAHLNWSSTSDLEKALKERVRTLVYTKTLDQPLLDALTRLMLEESTIFQDLLLVLQRNESQIHGISLSVTRETAGSGQWKDRILRQAHERLHDDRTEKVLAIYLPNDEEEQATCLHFVPAGPDGQSSPTLPEQLTRVLAQFESREEAYAILVIETAANLKKREAEIEANLEEEDDDDF